MLIYSEVKRLNVSSLMLSFDVCASKNRFCLLRCVKSVIFEAPNIAVCYSVNHELAADMHVIHNISKRFLRAGAVLNVDLPVNTMYSSVAHLR